MFLKFFLHSAELAAFVLPALPDEVGIRLGILSFYSLLHFYNVQKSYAAFKKRLLKDEPEEEESYESVNPNFQELTYNIYSWET